MKMNIQSLIGELVNKGMPPFGMVEVGGETFRLLCDELTIETQQLVQVDMTSDLLLNVTLPNGLVVYCNPHLPPNVIRINNVEGSA